MTAPGSSAGDDPGAELCSGGPAEHPAEGPPGGLGPAGAFGPRRWRGGVLGLVLGLGAAAGAAGLAARWAWSSRMCRSRSDRAGYLSPQSGQVRLDM